VEGDGATAGTVLVKDIWPRVRRLGSDRAAQPRELLYFAANEGTNGVELWKSDGTAVGTQLVKNIRAGSAE
jgi:ELWxxDGT repeat protein